MATDPREKEDYFSGDSLNLLLILDQHFFGNPHLPMTGVEVGVHRGWLSSRLLNVFTKLDLIMVDPWASLVSDARYIASEDELGAYGEQEQEACMLRALEVTNFARNRRDVCRFTSVEAASRIHEPVDWVFLDACHHYDSVVEDINIWWPLVKTGGFISGHDYTHYLNEKGSFGVRKAVNEFAAREPYPFQLKGSCWWMVKSLVTP